MRVLARPHLSHEIALPVTAKGSAAPANPSTPPAGAQSQARGLDPLHLVRELQEQESRQREYEARRLAAQLQQEALKTEQEQELRQEVKEKQGPHTKKKEELDSQEPDSNALGHTETDFDRETEEATDCRCHRRPQGALHTMCHCTRSQPPMGPPYLDGPGPNHQPAASARVARAVNTFDTMSDSGPLLTPSGMCDG